jgi:hypothetical protein
MQARRTNEPYLADNGAFSRRKATAHARPRITRPRVALGGYAVDTIRNRLRVSCVVNRNDPPLATPWVSAPARALRPTEGVASYSQTSPRRSSQTVGTRQGGHRLPLRRRRPRLWRWGRSGRGALPRDGRSATLERSIAGRIARFICLMHLERGGTGCRSAVAP